MTEHLLIWRSTQYRRHARHAASAQRRAMTNTVRWLFPFLSLLAPIFADAMGQYLLGCLLFGAAAALWGAHRTGAAWWIILWSLVTGGFAALLLLVEEPAIPGLALAAGVTAAIQAIALLGVAAPATLAGWRVRGLALLALAGPVALVLRTTGGGAEGPEWSLALAIALDLAGLPLAVMARGRVVS